MNLKSIAASALIGAATLVSAAPANAEFSPGQCKSYSDGSFRCMNMVAEYGSYQEWELGYTRGDTTEYLEVSCVGKTLDSWESYGNMTQSQAHNYAAHFCSL